jgi:hypothetical protein
MRLYWKMLLLASMVSPLLNPPASATGAQDLENVLLLYPDRLDLPDHHVFEQSLPLSLTASVATRLDFYHEFIRCQPLSGQIPGALGMSRRDS